MSLEAGSIALLLPLAAWISLFVTLCWGGRGLRESFLAASILWGIAVTVFTELPSLWSGLNFGSLLFGWGVLTLLCSVLMLKAYRERHTIAVPERSYPNKALILPTAAILAVTLLIALLAAPNTFDSMTYHMPRVMHWIQNGSVAHYPTGILRQLEMSPWAEYAVLHLQLLSGGDRCANLVQWFSLLGCIVGVSLIASQCAATSAGQALAAFFAATTFMGILQASSTQNDLCVSFWLICFVYFGLRLLKEQAPVLTLLMSCSLGLAVLTKGTAYIFALPFAFWFLAGILRRSWRRAAANAVVLGVTVLAVNGAHYYRNYRLFQHPLHSDVGAYANSYLSAGVFASNVTRNITLHLATPSLDWNRYGVSVIRGLHDYYGVDMDDPATTWPGTSFEQVRLAPHEDVSGNPLHLCLYLAVIVICAGKRDGAGMRCYIISVVAGFLLFCLLLRWQPWHSRLQLPLFFLCAPLAGALLANLHRQWLVHGLVGLFSLAALPWLLCNISRPLVTLSPLVPGYPDSILTVARQSSYFANRPELEKTYRETARLIAMRAVKNIGLDTGENGNAWEYPLWALTRTRGVEGPRIDHVGVTNISRRIPTVVRPDIRVAIRNDGKLSVYGQ